MLKILMVRLHILQAIHGCRYFHSKTHAAPFLCVFFIYAFFMPACVFYPLLHYNFDVGLFSFCCFFSLSVRFVRNVCFIYFLCALDSFFCVCVVVVFLPEMFIFLKLFFFSETPFISRFRYRFQPKKSHFQSYMTFATHPRSTYTHIPTLANREMCTNTYSPPMYILYITLTME